MLLGCIFGHNKRTAKIPMDVIFCPVRHLTMTDMTGNQNIPNNNNAAYQFRIGDQENTIITETNKGNENGN